MMQAYLVIRFRGVGYHILPSLKIFVLENCKCTYNCTLTIQNGKLSESQNIVESHVNSFMHISIPYLVILTSM